MDDLIMEERRKKVQALDYFEKMLALDDKHFQLVLLGNELVEVTDQLAQAQAVLDMNLTDGLQEEVLKKVLAVYCPDMPDERFNELIEDMKRRQADKANQEPHGGD